MLFAACHAQQPAAATTLCIRPCTCTRILNHSHRHLIASILLLRFITIVHERKLLDIHPIAAPSAPFSTVAVSSHTRAANISSGDGYVLCRTNCDIRAVDAFISLPLFSMLCSRRCLLLLLLFLHLDMFCTLLLLLLLVGRLLPIIIAVHKGELLIINSLPLCTCTRILCHIRSRNSNSLSSTNRDIWSMYAAVAAICRCR
jgi:hypothetical protein